MWENWTVRENWCVLRLNRDLVLQTIIIYNLKKTVPFERGNEVIWIKKNLPSLFLFEREIIAYTWTHIMGPNFGVIYSVIITLG